MATLPALLKSEVAALRRVVTDPQPNLSRSGVCMTSLQPDSWERYCKNIMRYGGFLVQFLGVAEAKLSLWAYTAMPHFFLFLSFLQVREVQAEELHKQVATSIMVLAHLRKGAGADKELLSRCSNHLEGLLQEVKGFQLRSKGVSTNPRREVAPAAPVLEWQDKVIRGALDAVKAELSQHDGQILDPAVHRAVRDAAMLGLAFGHVLLVARLTLLRSLKSVRFSATACSKEGCPKVGLGCKGNRLEGVHNPSLASTSLAASTGSNKGSFSMSMEHSSSLFKLCCAHHKNSGRGVPGFEVVIHSPQLHALLVVYEGSSRAFLLRHVEGWEAKEEEEE